VQVGGGDQQFELESHDILSELLTGCLTSVAETQLLDDDVFTLDPTKSMEPFLPRLDEKRGLRFHHANSAHGRYRLRLRGKRRGECRSQRGQHEAATVHTGTIGRMLTRVNSSQVGAARAKSAVSRLGLEPTGPPDQESYSTSPQEERGVAQCVLGVWLSIGAALDGDTPSRGNLPRVTQRLPAATNGRRRCRAAEPVR